MVRQHDIIEFVRSNIEEYDQFSDDEIRAIINDHINYGTYDEMRDNGKLIAVVRYNIDGPTAEILDLVIEPGYDSRYIMRRFIVRGWARFPYIRFISYHRMYKNPHRKLVILSIKKFLKIK